MQYVNSLRDAFVAHTSIFIGVVVFLAIWSALSTSLRSK